MSPAEKRWLEYVGANVRRLRLRRGLTQEQLGELASIAPRYVQDVERGRTNISFVVFIGLADALEVDPRDLLRPAKLAAPKPGRPAGS
jgi:transcriptional regulator with XRE-family HTH domain